MILKRLLVVFQTVVIENVAHYFGLFKLRRIPKSRVVVLPNRAL